MKIYYVFKKNEKTSNELDRFMSFFSITFNISVEIDLSGKSFLYLYV